MCGEKRSKVVVCGEKRSKVVVCGEKRSKVVVCGEMWELTVSLVGEQGEGREEERVVGHEGAEVRDEEEEERVTSHEGADSQFPNTQQLFGGESS